MSLPSIHFRRVFVSSAILSSFERCVYTHPFSSCSSGDCHGFTTTNANDTKSWASERSLEWSHGISWWWVWSLGWKPTGNCAKRVRRRNRLVLGDKCSKVGSLDQNESPADLYRCLCVHDRQRATTCSQRRSGGDLLDIPSRPIPHKKQGKYPSSFSGKTGT